jgi:hypothetical protein
MANTNFPERISDKKEFSRVVFCHESHESWSMGTGLDWPVQCTVVTPLWGELLDWPVQFGNLLRDPEDRRNEAW